jgi:hypothetical protein
MGHDVFLQCPFCFTDHQHLPMSYSKHTNSDMEMKMPSYLKAIQGTLAVDTVDFSWSFWKKTVTVS